jgi:hypothetical protein
MSLERRINRLNTRFADVFGRIPVEFGALPKIAWKWSASLVFPVEFPDGRCEMERQMELHELGGGDRWLIAQWFHPGTRAQWHARFGRTLGYPERGLYISNNAIWIRLGQEPNEDATDWAIGKIKQRQALTPQQARDLKRDAQALIEKRQAQNWSDFIDQHIPDHIPGRRGQHVSFGGFEVPIVGN